MADGGNKSPGQFQTVLLVCRNEDTIGTLAGILSQRSQKVLTAQTPEDGLECLRVGNNRWNIQCVVLDYTEPNVPALTLFMAARSAPPTRHIPFLFLVGSDGEVPAFNYMSPGAITDAFLPLPCTAEDFTACIKLLLEQEPAAQAGTPAPPDTREKQPASPDAVFSGQLGVLAVTQILHIIEPLKFTGALRVADHKRTGIIYFINGAVRHAELNEIEGPDALFLMFHLKEGLFRFDLSVPTPKITIEGNTMLLLLEGLRQMDEHKARIKAFQSKRDLRRVAGQPLADTKG